jgi:hypothetical protein
MSTQTKQLGIVIDLDQLRDLMREFTTITTSMHGPLKRSFNGSASAVW